MSAITQQDLAHALAWHGEGFVRTLGEVPPDAPVPSCPGWTASDLGWHLAGVWARVTNAVRDGSGHRDAYRGHALRDRPDDAELPGWCGEVLLGLLVALREAGPGARAWNWTDQPQDAAWWGRRLAHETAVHHVDAELVRGGDVEVARCLAADGVDEFFPVYAARADGGPLDGTVDVVAEDVDGAAWRLDLEDGLLVCRRHGDLPAGDGPGVAAVVHGPAQQLLRWVWRRPATVTVEGDGHVAAQLQAWCFAG